MPPVTITLPLKLDFFFGFYIYVMLDVGAAVILDGSEKFYMTWVHTVEHKASGVQKILLEDLKPLKQGWQHLSRDRIELSAIACSF